MRRMNNQYGGGLGSSYGQYAQDPYAQQNAAQKMHRQRTSAQTSAQTSIGQPYLSPKYVAQVMSSCIDGPTCIVDEPRGGEPPEADLPPSQVSVTGWVLTLLLLSGLSLIGWHVCHSVAQNTIPAGAEK